MTVRVEAKNASSDKEYVTAVECASKEEAEVIASELRSRFGSVKVVKPEKGDK